VVPTAVAGGRYLIGRYEVDRRKPEVNGQPHYSMVGSADASGMGHVYVAPNQRWVVRDLYAPGDVDVCHAWLECHYMIQPLVELCGGCMAVLKVS
jgi:hypothetical protein